MSEALAAQGEIASSLVMLSLARLARMAQENDLEACDGAACAPQIVCLRQGDSESVPLVLVHPVGGSVIPYRDLVPHIAGDRAVYAIQSQIEARRSSLDHDDIASLAADYVDQVKSLGLGRGIVLGGYSLGGAVAFEMARQSQAAGLKVERVVIIDTPATIRPVSSETQVPITINQLLMFGQMLAAVAQHRLDITAAELEALPEALRVHHVIARLRALKVIPEGANEQIYHDIYRLVRHNERLQREFAPLPYDGDVALIRTKDEAAILREEAGAIYDDPSFGWSALCSRPIRIVKVPGSHLQLLYQPFIRGLGKALQWLVDDLSGDRESERRAM